MPSGNPPRSTGTQCIGVPHITISPNHSISAYPLYGIGTGTSYWHAMVSDQDVVDRIGTAHENQVWHHVIPMTVRISRNVGKKVSRKKLVFRRVNPVFSHHFLGYLSVKGQFRVKNSDFAPDIWLNRCLEGCHKALKPSLAYQY